MGNWRGEGKEEGKGRVEGGRGEIKYMCKSVFSLRLLWPMKTKLYLLKR